MPRPIAALVNRTLDLSLDLNLQSMETFYILQSTLLWKSISHSMLSWTYA